MDWIWVEIVVVYRVLNLIKKRGKDGGRDGSGYGGGWRVGDDLVVSRNGNRKGGFEAYCGCVSST